VRASDGETLRQLALVGAGLARLSHYHIHADLEAGRLVPVLEKYNPRDMAPIHAVYIGKAGRLPSRVRAVLDFLDAHVATDRAFAGASHDEHRRPRPLRRARDP
jgi:DNA-binding transcriptional LysR family regulator